MAKKHESTAFAVACVGGPFDGMKVPHTKNINGKRMRAPIAEINPARPIPHWRQTLVKGIRMHILTYREYGRYHYLEGVYVWTPEFSENPPRRTPSTKKEES